jgi:DNA-binding PadR family transcriptional regulator
MAKHDSLRGSVELVVLEMLSRGRLTNAYAIKQAIASESNGVLKIRDSTLYPAIDRMEGKGWIESEANDTKYDRRVWILKLTAEGKKHLRSERISWRRFSSAVDQILAGRKSPRVSPGRVGLRRIGSAGQERSARTPSPL